MGMKIAADRERDLIAIANPLTQAASAGARYGGLVLPVEPCSLQRLSGRLFEMGCDQHFDLRLARHPEAESFATERLDHPHRELHIHASLLTARPSCLCDLEIPRDVFACIRLLVQSFRSGFHELRAPRLEHGARKRPCCAPLDRSRSQANAADRSSPTTTNLRSSVVRRGVDVRASWGPHTPCASTEHFKMDHPPAPASAARSSWRCPGGRRGGPPRRARALR